MTDPEQQFDVSTYHAALKQRNAEDLARIETAALGRGVEPFNLETLRGLARHCRSVMAPDEDSLKFAYYWGEPDFRTLADYAAYLLELDVWADSS